MLLYNDVYNYLKKKLSVKRLAKLAVGLFVPTYISVPIALFI